MATGSGRILLRVLTGGVLAVFVLAYAAVGLVLFPVVASVLGIGTLARRTITLGRRLSGWALGTRVAIRTILIGWISLGR